MPGTSGCLRLALALDFGRRAVSLPLILDDVLVNFDPERAAAMARVLVESATTQQALLLTCRPETVSAVRAVSPAVRVVELPRFGGRDAPAAPSAEETGDNPTDTERAAELLHETLLAATEPLRKSDLLERSGLALEQWTSAIQALRDRGAVDQEGHGKGTRYEARRAFLL